MASINPIEACRRWITLEDDEKSRHNDEAYQSAEERPMGNHPSSGCEPGETHIEHSDRHLDKACSDVEEELLVRRELSGIDISVPTQ